MQNRLPVSAAWCASFPAAARRPGGCSRPCQRSGRLGRAALRRAWAGPGVTGTSAPPGTTRLEPSRCSFPNPKPASAVGRCRHGGGLGLPGQGGAGGEPVHRVNLSLLALTLQAARRPGAAWTRRRWRRACAQRTPNPAGPNPAGGAAAWGRLDKAALEACLCTAALALAAVMAGSGHLPTLRLLRGAPRWGPCLSGRFAPPVWSLHTCHNLHHHTKCRLACTDAWRQWVAPAVRPPQPRACRAGGAALSVFEPVR